MKGILESRGARIIIEDCANIKSGEKVLIISDFESIGSAELLSREVWAKKADLNVIVMPPRKVDGQEPPDCVAAAMKKVDVILLAVSVSITHSSATIEAEKAGARVLSLTGVSEETIASGAFEADFKKEKPTCEKIASIFDLGNEVRITSPSGTNLVVSSKGRPGNSHSCIIDGPGQFSAAPNIEANFAPVEGTAEGVYVSDLSIPYLGIGLLTEPIKFTITKGKIIKIEGGQQADKIKKIWEEQNDPNVYNIAQVAIGLNPMIKEAKGTLGCCYDEGTYGTVHIGIGTSSHIGGVTKASTHFDALVKNPTLVVDGKKVLENGDVLIK